MISPDKKIEPLREDIGKIVPNKFLTSTSYKRWIVANNLQDVWGQCLDYAKSEQSLYVTLKLRKGWDLNNIVAVEFAKMAEKAGVSAITIHGRTRTEMYSGKADLDIIKKVKEVVNIPVIGNGDIIDEESALKMFEYTGVDGIMIGRGVFGNPWIFEKIRYFLETGEKLPEISNEEKLRVIKKHIEYELEEKQEITAIRELRKHIAWYTKNMPNSSDFRNEINKIEDKERLIKKVEEFFRI